MLLGCEFTPIQSVWTTCLGDFNEHQLLNKQINRENCLDILVPDLCKCSSPFKGSAETWLFARFGDSHGNLPFSWKTLLREFPLLPLRIGGKRSLYRFKG